MPPSPFLFLEFVNESYFSKTLTWRDWETNQSVLLVIIYSKLLHASPIFSQRVFSPTFLIYLLVLFFFFPPYVILYFTAVQKKRRKNLQDRKKKKRNLILMIKVHKLKHHLLPSPPHRLSKHTGKLKKARVLLQLKGFHSTTVQK